MTHEELQAIKARAEAATPGPWDATDNYVTIPGVGSIDILTNNPMEGDSSHDTTFIAHARTDVPALVAEVERLREIAEAVYARAWYDARDYYEQDIGGPSFAALRNRAIEAVDIETKSLNETMMR